MRITETEDLETLEEALQEAESMGYKTLEEAYKDLYERGWNTVTLSEYFGMPRGSIAGALGKMGVKFRGRGKNKNKALEM